MNTPDKPFSLSGKRIILLGGSSGLGLATAKAAAAEGAHVVIVSSHQQRVNDALAQLSSDSLGVALDLSQEENIHEFFDHIGPFDHLVYTAGENISLNRLETLNIAQAKDYFAVRFWGAFAAVKYGAPHIKSGGSICLTSGITSQRPGAGWSLGTSICSAMEGFCRAMAVELAPIRVNIVSPGLVRTNLWSGMNEADRANLFESIGNQLLVKRIGEPEEIAQTFLFMMKQPFATGQCFTIDGGASLV
ncbi:short-chain dehydrogenase [Spirosoma radiotolerans]|uniref:Short-chain dehydrogenase n=2 Tax=Spirosoma radiotolerans TaxID=1379870 RepID=A0A0E3ZZ18_9BACT|nr:short-chain dehydrogenase [Spirosoma radiotolerans]